MIWVLCYSIAYGFVECSNYEYPTNKACVSDGEYWRTALKPHTSFRYICVKRTSV